MILYNACPVCNDVHIRKVIEATDHTVSGENFEIWECANCTLRFTQNVPGEEQIGAYYKSENYISHSDTSKGLVNSLYHFVRKRTLSQKKHLIEKVTGKKTGKILDVGAGTAAFLNLMKNSGWKTLGAEPDEKAREKALELYGISLLPVNEIYSLDKGSFDAITMWHVLEHVHQLHQTVELLKDILSPDGKIFIAVPNYTAADEKMYKNFWAAYDVPRHLYHFSPLSMKILLEGHGLQIESIKPMWFDSFYVSMLSEKYETGKSNIIRAFSNGFRSNLKALSDKTTCSSLIYIAGKK